MFYEGEEFFGDDTYVGPGWTPALSEPPLTFGPLQDGTWRAVVSSYNGVLADKEFEFNCGS